MKEKETEVSSPFWYLWCFRGQVSYTGNAICQVLPSKSLQAMCWKFEQNLQDYILKELLYILLQT